jgi:hypothetical protein
MAVDPRRNRLNRLKGGAPGEPVEDKKVVEVDFSKSDQRSEYIKTKLDDILDKIGQSYGKKMTDELIKRLDQTIAEFHTEVLQVLTKLEGLEEERQKPVIAAHPPKEEEVPEEETGEATEMSEFEKRLERMEKEKKQKDKVSKTEEEGEKPKKKGLFRRK